MNHELIRLKTLEVYRQCNIKSFPLDIDFIYNFYKLIRYTYSCKDELFKKFCFKMSDDAFYWEGLILFNEEANPQRLVFSFAHELGHHILKHSSNRTPSEETEANYFASHILAPRMAIHYSKCKNHVQVSKLFGISLEASQYAFDDYRRWHRRAVYKMNDFDKAMYTHFYNEQYKGFVYNIKTCKLCGKELLNHKSEYCDPCFNRLSFRNYNDRNLYAAENNWLYGGL
ncbi:MAG: ImmA/IrrE family metallo-endopeptidase [Anaerocolumna aminovalerica]|uniref:ImmA/IrrE family metallo-endopeptidase n=1 Tax=Anaerocolumna aminovalerica TaxID=1527 RepID=UPI00291114CD|nr:ImmA/IrrE family metallo-endopeptidase [Anaerocolumna aminovalerica]MDU6263793.1 ImmA/IrrE family metallo-endopeptidase [Anaerocolumna aminovalerica]